MMTEKRGRCPFVIMNTDRSNREGTHWWSFLIYTRKKRFFFDSFGFEGFKHFIMQNDKKILNKILFGIEKFKRKDKKITLITLKLSMKEYEKIRHANRLGTTVIDLLHLIREFGKLHGIKDEVTIHLVDGQLQKRETDTGGIFRLYFYVNLFMPIEGCSIINDKTLSKFTLEKLLNEIFVTIHLVDGQLQKLETDTGGIFRLYFYINLFMPIEGCSIINDKTLSKFTLEKLLNEIFVTIHLVDGQLQKLETDTGGIFWLYFYINLFMPIEGCSIINDKTLKNSPSKNF